jgi:hypothetical protein
MLEEKENQRTAGICSEDVPFAEMMQKMMGQKGVGAEIMREMLVLDDYQVWFLTQISARHRA